MNVLNVELRHLNGPDLFVYCQGVMALQFVGAFLGVLDRLYSQDNCLYLPNITYSLSTIFVFSQLPGIRLAPKINGFSV